MSYDYILFSLFASFSLISSIMVIGLSNAVHSVLFLIFLFCNVASLLLLLGAEFLSLIFLIVYVGAIAVLFLFVIMMLNVKINNLKTMNYTSITPIGTAISFILFFQFSVIINSNFIPFKDNVSVEWVSWISENNSNTNLEVLGFILYTKYSFLFLLCSLILLVSMMGAIVLTMHQRTKLQKQNIIIQVSREPKETIKFVNLRN